MQTRTAALIIAAMIVAVIGDDELCIQLPADYTNTITDTTQCMVTSDKDLQSIPDDAVVLNLQFSQDHDFDIANGLQLDIPTLKSLHLDVTYIKHIAAGFFKLPQLQTLELYHVLPPAYNFELTLEEGAFRNLGDLTNLHLLDLGIKDLVPGVFDGLGQLQVLTLNRNDLTELPHGVFDGMSNLNTLFVANNKISNLNYVDFTGLSSLKSLNLYNNRITELRQHNFNGLKSLAKLNVENNHLNTIDSDAFNKLQSLQALYMDNNNLSSIQNGTFNGQLSNLNTLRLTYNRLTDIPSIDSDVLQHLFIDYNSINSVPPGIFSHLPALQTLSIGNNAIKILPHDVFSSNDRLRTISLSSNNITMMDSDVFASTMSLEYLSLADNHLAEVPSLHELKHLSYIDISSNPLLCDCDLYWFYIMSKNYQHYNEVPAPTCAGGTNFSDIYASNELGCSVMTTTEHQTTQQTEEVTEVTTFSNPSNFSGQGADGNDNHNDPPSVLSLSAKAGIISGIVLVSIVVLVISVLCAYKRQRRHRMWTPSKDPLCRNGRDVYKQSPMPPLHTQTSQNSISDSENISVNVNTGDAHVEIPERLPVTERGRDLRDSGLGDSALNLRRPQSMFIDRAGDDMNLHAPPPKQAISVRSVNSYEGTIFNDTSQHFPSSHDLVYM